MSLDTPLSSFPRIGPKSAAHLKRLGLTTARDLLFYFPTRYEDLSSLTAIGALRPGTHAVIQGTIIRVYTHRSFRKHMAITEIVVEDNTGAIKAIWFNQPYIGKALGEGATVNLAGKVIEDAHGIYLTNPLYELVTSPHQHTRHTGRIIPIYRETRGVTSKAIRYFLTSLLEIIKELPEYLPEEVLTRRNFPTLSNALQNVHYPETLSAAERARARFMFEHLFLVSLARELKTKKEAHKGTPLVIHLPEIKQCIDTLPFALTEAQKEAVWIILKDMAEEKPMQRLLNGDVGSGKTVVAALAAYNTILNARQVVVMAPTEILALQHFHTFSNLFRNLPIAIGMLAGKNTSYAFEGLSSPTKKKTLLENIKNGSVHIVIGTHALIQKETSFAHPALIVIDEQHRFGVAQRTHLMAAEHAIHGTIPHLLSMTATPIPRTLALTIFGDMDISILNEMPKGRKKIITSVIPPEKRAASYAFIREEVKKGFQTFVICPRIEAASSGEDNNHRPPTKQKTLWLEVKTVTEEYEKLQKQVFPDLRVGMLHGKMKPDEKEHIMRAFANQKLDILVSTSVVEVGVDIPNATVMLIESAERFGLAQLHQFRGRIGRNTHQSYCLLFTTSLSQLEARRLTALTKTQSGFVLAEMDLKLRGPGEFLGEEQSGWSDMVMAALRNPAMLSHAEEDARAFLREHSLREFPDLIKKLDEFTGTLNLV
ncbi:MAG: ATP-dependent DNA helicase RecG [Patescibacteria group bacterium]|nr:ATP-dependent DNA helicase RecG [Patescibacteria group bacterium]MDE2438383.1 ATP-dependent DNA helicase RecG [Patescibacteria group bacterium]